MLGSVAEWAEQLAEGAVLLVLMEHAGGHPLCLLHKEPGGLRGRVASWTAFMSIRGPLHVDGLWRGLPAALAGARNLA